MFCIGLSRGEGCHFKRPLVQYAGSPAVWLSEPGFGKIIGIEGMNHSGPVQLREAGSFSFTDSRRLSNRAVRHFD